MLSFEAFLFIFHSSYNIQKIKYKLNTQLYMKVFVFDFFVVLGLCYR